MKKPVISHDWGAANYLDGVIMRYSVSVGDPCKSGKEGGETLAYFKYPADANRFAQLKTVATRRELEFRRRGKRWP